MLAFLAIFPVGLVMDLTIENSLGMDSLSVNSQEKMSMSEIGERLRKAVPGIAVIDNDFSLKTKEYELGMGGKQPGRLPDESMRLLSDLKDLGWEVLVVSNQPKEGHQIARFIKGISKDKYPIFPDSVKEVLGNEGVDGGGKDFLWNKYKNTSEAVEKTAEWISGKTQKVLGQIYFVGDRESDVEFAKKVEGDLKNRGENRAVNIWKVKGLDLPKILKPLEKLIP